MKINQKQLIDSGVTMAGATVGSVAGRIAYGKTEKFIKNDKIRSCILFGLGVALAAFSDGKTAVQQMMMGAGVGLASTSATMLIKSFVEPKEDTLLGIGLGATEQEPIIVYSDSYPSNYLSNYQNNWSNQNNAIQLGYAETEASFPMV